jgi:two-component system response regulator (stage 0 sporulation protein A)
MKMKNFRAAEKTELTVSISDILCNLGVPQHIKGFFYLREAIYIMVLYPQPLNIRMSKHIYPAVAEKYSTTTDCVARAMSHGIDYAMERGSDALIYSVFGNTICKSRGKPTNNEFISLISERIRAGRKSI